MAVDPANHRQDFHVIGVRKMPPGKSATLHLALMTSLVCIGGVERRFPAALLEDGADLHSLLRSVCATGQSPPFKVSCCSHWATCGRSLTTPSSSQQQRSTDARETEIHSQSAVVLDTRGSSRARRRWHTGSSAGIRSPSDRRVRNGNSRLMQSVQ
jgi:hypothetical protein